MRTITENFRIIVEKQSLMGYFFPTVLRPPASLEEIRSVETKINFKFNKELIELYSIHDGIDVPEIACGLLGLVPVHIFMKLEEATKYCIDRLYQEDQFENSTKKYKPDLKLFPFLNEDGRCYWVDLNEGTKHYGKIYYCNSYYSEPDYAFESLTSMFETIAECYGQGVFYLEEEGYLSENDTWYEIAKKNNPTLTEYWESWLI